MTESKLKFFTASYAVAKFKQHAGVDFHPTVPGQLLATRRVPKCGLDDGKALYDAQNWDQLWIDMVSLAKNRARYGQNAQPTDCIPPLPDYMLRNQRDELGIAPIKALKQAPALEHVKQQVRKAYPRTNPKYGTYASTSDRVNRDANARFNHALDKDE